MVSIPICQSTVNYLSPLKGPCCWRLINIKRPRLQGSPLIHEAPVKGQIFISAWDLFEALITSVTLPYSTQQTVHWLQSAVLLPQYNETAPTMMNEIYLLCHLVSGVLFLGLLPCQTWKQEWNHLKVPLVDRNSCSAFIQSTVTLIFKMHECCIQTKSLCLCWNVRKEKASLEEQQDFHFKYKYNCGCVLKTAQCAPVCQNYRVCLQWSALLRSKDKASRIERIVGEHHLFSRGLKELQDWLCEAQRVLNTCISTTTDKGVLEDRMLQLEVRRDRTDRKEYPTILI